MQAAEMFAAEVSAPEIAKRLRVSAQSVSRWKAAYSVGGAEALVSKGPLGQRPKLSAKSQAKLSAMLEEGPAAHGWAEDQVWTGARVATLIGRTFHVSYSVSAATRLMRRLGFTPQQPARRAAERDEAAITTFTEVTWPQVKGGRR
jgi:transposase